MHIPDGYLSPQTCAACRGGHGAGLGDGGPAGATKVKSRDVPLLAIGAAYCFLVMMFNVPDPRRHDRARGGRGADRGAARARGRP